MSIAEKRLKEIQARLEDSEPGPWYHEPIRDCHELTTVYYCFHNGDTWDRDLVAESTGGNVALIANAPADLADLLAEVHRLRDELAKAREVTEDKVEKGGVAANDVGWTCYGGVHEPGSYHECPECKKVSDQLARCVLNAALGVGDDG